MRTASPLWLSLMLVACGGGGATSSATTTTAGAGGSSSSSSASSSGGSASSAGGAGGEAGQGGAGASGGTAIVCPAQALTPGEHAASILFGGNERDYEVQVPLNYDNTSPRPLVFDLHGYTESADIQQSKSGWQQLAESEGLIVVRPDGSGVFKSFNGGDVCCGTAQSQNLDDVGLMKAIVNQLKTELCIDAKRIYASGLSNGGAMSHRLACEAADVFAAVAPVSYPLDFNPNSKCQPSRPIAVIHSHGIGDLVVPFNGGITAQSAPASFAYWAQVNGCTGNPVETYTKGSSHCDTYQSCQAGVEVTLCSINGGHQLYTNTNNVPIAEVSWAFLSQFILP